MGDRDALGAADVSDARLAAIVASLLGVDEVSLADVHVESVAYDIPAITTASRHWVSGQAVTTRGTEPFRIFVKHVQSWERHPFFQFVPEEFRDLATAGVPWRTEPEIYRSDLADRLPDGLTMPRALDVSYLDELSAAIWLEEVPARDAVWDLERYRRAAYLVGRLAASADVAPLADLRDVDWSLGVYTSGRLDVQVIPMLMSDELWQHPLCASFDDELRERLRAAAARADDLAAEGDALPWLTSHGDACPNNLLAGDDPDGFVLIDFGYFGPAPVGFDLSGLLVGEVQLGRSSADTLAEVDATIIPAYVDGLRTEGCDISEDVVRRAHAIRTLLMTGLSAVPFDFFEAPMDDAVRRLAADRAVLARYCLDALDATS